MAAGSDPTDFPTPCLYLQIDTSAHAAAGGVGDGAAGGARARESGIGEWLHGPPMHAGGGSTGRTGDSTARTAPDANGAIGEADAGAEAGDDDDDDDDGDGGGAEPLSEVRLVPEDPSALERLFREMSACAALHPCGDEEEGEEGGGVFGGEDEGTYGEDDGDDDEYVPSAAGGAAGDAFDAGGGGGGLGHGLGALPPGALPARFFAGDGELTPAQQAMLDRFDSMLNVSGQAQGQAPDWAAGLSPHPPGGGGASPLGADDGGASGAALEADVGRFADAEGEADGEGARRRMEE